MNFYKKIVAFAISFSFPLIIGAQSLNYPKFLETTGMDLVAKLAHPIWYSNDMFLPEKSKCIIYHNEFYFILQFKVGWTIINFKQENGIIRSASIYDLSDVFSAPFSTLEFMFMFSSGTESELGKDPIWNQVANYYTGVFGKEFTEFDGYELTITALAWKWAVAVTEEEKKVNNKPATQSTNQITRVIDGIKVIGTPEFTRRIEESLKIIEDYDPFTYDNFFRNTTNKYNLVKTITYNTSNSYSTIAGNGVINLHDSYSYFHHENILTSSGFDLAGTLVHEMTHLYQHYEYSKLIDCTVLGFTLSYSYDPIENAEIEIEAYDVTNEFLNKILRRVSPDGNAFIRTTVTNKIAENDKKKGYYNILSDAGYYLFESHSENPKCGQSCMSLFYSTLEKFGKINESFANTEKYLKWLYH